jgi:drug/metabolite transporter (DMT)-like permease
MELTRSTEQSMIAMRCIYYCGHKQGNENIMADAGVAAAAAASITASDWIKGIALSVLASIIGSASKLAIRKSWLMQEYVEQSILITISADVATTPDSAPPSPIIVQNGSSPQMLHTKLLLQNRSSFTTHNHDLSAVAPYHSLRCAGMFGMCVLNPACGVLAMRYASPSILAPFSGLTLVWVVLFSMPIVGERPTLIQVTAATLIVLGEVIVVIVGDHTNEEGVTIQNVVSCIQKSTE